MGLGVGGSLHRLRSKATEAEIHVWCLNWQCLLSILPAVRFNYESITGEWRAELHVHSQGPQLSEETDSHVTE